MKTVVYIDGLSRLKLDPKVRHICYSLCQFMAEILSL
jgi:hypothetical protein